jgi:hypothetical protein
VDAVELLEACFYSVEAAIDGGEHRDHRGVHRRDLHGMAVGSAHAALGSKRQASVPARVRAWYAARSTRDVKANPGILWLFVAPCSREIHMEGRCSARSGRSEMRTCRERESGGGIIACLLCGHRRSSHGGVSQVLLQVLLLYGSH